ncbi:CHAT domain-containing protein [Reichenbachiella ulvae]|uniref:CHAT domain-containing protein n=1 Tax=Reichenbachiella ulvae TaxID=2980104 RepID=A0ABT3CR67_9BACT|nr:CHAT domain-containing protein [Reichenbachiella ulvae]MCV9385768.1 CHAT domain-containing protein [Reichenbachiella ulvae]
MSYYYYYYYYAFFETSKEEQQTWINQVFDYRLANKALLFQSVKNLKEAIYELNDPALMEAYLLWIKTKENLSKLNKVDHQTLAKSGLDKDSLLELSNELEKKISLKVAVSKNNKRDMDLLNWQSVANSLSEDEMAIEIIRLRDFDVNTGQFTDSIRYACLALNKRMNNGPKLVMLENGNQMEVKQLKTYRNLVKFKMADEVSYDVFVNPLIEGFNRDMRKNIYMSPDGVYNQINLNTLLNTETNEYFINEYNLLLLSSLRDLIEEDKPNYQSNTSSAEFYFFGYPNYQYNPLKGETEGSQPASTDDGGERSIHFQMKNMISRGAEITLLPGTLEEVEAASAIVSDHVEEEVITGNEATEERVKALESPGLLHIATHGFFLNEDPPKTEPFISDDLTTIQLSNPFINPLFNSGLMLTGAAHAYDSLVLLKELVAIQSGGIAEDGIMTSYEVMNISLRDTKLVILSACETGLGKVKSGEGVYGLQRAFQTAGADAVVISLWKVSDAATKDLMILFYKNYVEGKAPRDAFVAAQQELKTKYESPYYWGAFIFVGGSTSEGMIKQPL